MAKSGQRFANWRDCCRLWIGATEELFRLFALNWLYRTTRKWLDIVHGDRGEPGLHLLHLRLAVPEAQLAAFLDERRNVRGFAEGDDTGIRDYPGLLSMALW